MPSNPRSTIINRRSVAPTAAAHPTTRAGSASRRSIAPISARTVSTPATTVATIALTDEIKRLKELNVLLEEKVLFLLFFVLINLKKYFS